MPYPAGSIGVDDPRLQDISGGMQWNMQDAYDIRFLAVSGTVTVGPSRARYDFTLVEYCLYIDEVPWLLFSTLNDALEKEGKIHPTWAFFLDHWMCIPGGMSHYVTFAIHEKV